MWTHPHHLHPKTMPNDKSPPEPETVAQQETSGDCVSLLVVPLRDALSLADFGPCRTADRPQDWINVASPMCAHCEGVEDVNLAAARIIAWEYRNALAMLERCELWLSTMPEGRKMQLECQRVISRHNVDVDARPRCAPHQQDGLWPSQSTGLLCSLKISDTMKIYRVQINYDTIIRATSREDAERQANRILRASDEEPKALEAVEITSLKELPMEWNGDCRPWGETDPHDRTLSEILGHNVESIRPESKP